MEWNHDGEKDEEEAAEGAFLKNEVSGFIDFVLTYARCPLEVSVKIQIGGRGL